MSAEEVSAELTMVAGLGDEVVHGCQMDIAGFLDRM